jgi:hypothetical protein
VHQGAFARERDLQTSHDRSGDFVLDVEDIGAAARVNDFETAGMRI